MHHKRSCKRHAVIQPLDPSYRLIPLTQGQNAIVDTKDYDWLNQWNWCAQWNPHTSSFYARRKHCAEGKWQHLAMHAVILGCSGDIEGDHINRNTLDNRRVNLRESSFQQNGFNKGLSKRNKTGFKGVFFRFNRYRAMIRYNNKLIHLGSFIFKEDAARCYDEAAKRLHGEFAGLNFSASPASKASVNSESAS